MLETKTFIDQMGRSVQVPLPPRRIVSLVPSQTELLYDLGLEDAVVGITRFCVHPEDWFGKKQRVGGTKDFDPERIAKLKPDLIIANKEENSRPGILKLAEDFPVWISDVRDAPTAFEMMRGVGKITAKEEKAETLIKEIQSGISDLARPEKKLSAAYLIWKKPWMAAGDNTFINAMLEICGFQNVLAGKEEHYPTIDIKSLSAKAIDVLMLSSEPYPFSEKHIDELQPHFPNTKILRVDGEMFSWYGSRMRRAPGYFSSLQKQIFT